MPSSSATAIASSAIDSPLLGRTGGQCWDAGSFRIPTTYQDTEVIQTCSNMLICIHIYYTYNTCICSPELLTRQDLPFYVYIVRIWAIKKQIARSCCKLGPLVQYEDKSSLTSCLENIISPYISHGFLGEQWYPHIFSIYVPIYIILVSSMSNICFRDRSGGRCCGGSCIAATQAARRRVAAACGQCHKRKKRCLGILTKKYGK